MTDWTDFADALDLGPLIPEAFARYRQAILDGMMAFLDKLPDEQTAAILLDQAMLPEEAPIAARLVAIARHCPALHKLAQVLARDRRLPAELRAHLQTLETMPPSQELDWLTREIEAEIGPLEALGIRLDEEPLAEASVAIVVPFVWTGGERPGAARCLQAAEARDRGGARARARGAAGDRRDPGSALRRVRAAAHRLRGHLPPGSRPAPPRGAPGPGAAPPCRSEGRLRRRSAGRRAGAVSLLHAQAHRHGADRRRQDHRRSGAGRDASAAGSPPPSSAR